MTATSKQTKLFAALITILAISGVAYFFLLSTAPIVAKSVYIDENGLLAGQARPAALPATTIPAIHEMIKGCYTPQINTPELLASCICDVTASLNFRCSYSSNSSTSNSYPVLTIHYTPPRTSESEAVVFGASMFPYELSDSISGLAVVLSHAMTSIQTGYLSHSIYITVPVPPPLFIQSSSLSTGQSAPSPFLTKEEFEKIATTSANPYPLLTYYKSWRQHYLSNFTEYHTNTPLQISILVFVAVDLPPHSCHSELSLHVIYPKANQGNLDTSASLLYTLRSSNVYIHSPQTPLTFATYNITNSDQPIDLVPFLWNTDLFLHSYTSQTGMPLRSFVHTPDKRFPIIYRLFLRIQREIYSIITQLYHVLLPLFGGNISDKYIYNGLSNEAAGLLRTLFAQGNAMKSSHFHSVFGDLSSDAVTLTSIVSRDSMIYEYLLSLEVEEKSHIHIIPTHKTKNKILSNKYNLLVSSLMRSNPVLSKKLNAILNGGGTNSSNNKDNTTTTTTTNNNNNNSIDLPPLSSLHNIIEPVCSITPLTRLSQSLELWTRMMSNAHERFHHSTWLYFLETAQVYLPMGSYYIGFTLLWACIAFTTLRHVLFPPIISMKMASPDTTLTTIITTTQTVSPSPNNMMPIYANTLSDILCGLILFTLSFIYLISPVLQRAFLYYIVVPYKSILGLSNNNIITIDIIISILLCILYCTSIIPIAKRIRSMAVFTVFCPVLGALFFILFSYGSYLLFYLLPLVFTISFAPSTSPRLVRLLHKIITLCVLVICSPITWILIYTMVSASSSLEPSSICMTNLYSGPIASPADVGLCYMQRWRGVNIDNIQYTHITSQISHIISSLYTAIISGKVTYPAILSQLSDIAIKHVPSLLHTINSPIVSLLSSSSSPLLSFDPLMTLQAILFFCVYIPIYILSFVQFFRV